MFTMLMTCRTLVMQPEKDEGKVRQKIHYFLHLLVCERLW